MTTNLRELYHEMIIDHGRSPRHFGEIENPSHMKEGFNPLCGDQLTIFLNTEQDKITNLKFKGCGCAISMASASLMAEAMQNKSEHEALTIFEKFIEAVTHANASFDDLGKLKVLAGVSEFPARVKCATLAWHTLKAILTDSDQPVSTE
jgi:nitrogen fixation NifU-like protein